MPNGPQPQEDMAAALEPFTAETGIKVDVEVVDWGVQLDRIRNAAVSGEGPDVTQAGTTQVPFFAALGGFEDLAARVGDIGGESAYADGVWQTTQVVGQDGTWAIPWFTEARSIYYRVGGSDLMMFKSSQHKNEAWELMKFLSQDQVQTDYAARLGMFPARVEPQQAYGESNGANFEATRSRASRSAARAPSA